MGCLALRGESGGGGRLLAAGPGIKDPGCRRVWAECQKGLPERKGVQPQGGRGSLSPFLREACRWIPATGQEPDTVAPGLPPSSRVGCCSRTLSSTPPAPFPPPSQVQPVRTQGRLPLLFPGPRGLPVPSPENCPAVPKQNRAPQSECGAEVCGGRRRRTRLHWPLSCKCDLWFPFLRALWEEEAPHGRGAARGFRLPSLLTPPPPPPPPRLGSCSARPTPRPKPA